MNYEILTLSESNVEPDNHVIDNIDKHIINSNTLNKNKNAITVLTRGYDSNEKYLSLINRNKGISKNLINKDIDIVIFHEGNITDIQQNYIKNETPDLKIIFTDISEFAFKKENEEIPFYKSYDKNINPPKGYRHMCHFWFIDFLKYCENYNYILRIDEDCFIDFNIDEIFDLLPNKLIIAGMNVEDENDVVYGLNNFTLKFLINNNLNNIKPRLVDGPYTNIFALNLIKVRNNELILKYMESIDNSKNIYVYRWGDLPLWGEVLHYICEPNDYLITDKIKYFHGSLITYVNGSSNYIKEMVNNVYKDDILKYEQKDEELKQKQIQYLNRKNEIISNRIINKINLLKNIKENNYNKKFKNILSL
jgi:hypothetical protein